MGNATTLLLGLWSCVCAGPGGLSLGPPPSGPSGAGPHPQAAARDLRWPRSPGTSAARRRPGARPARPASSPRHDRPVPRLLVQPLHDGKHRVALGSEEGQPSLVLRVLMLI